MNFSLLGKIKLGIFFFFFPKEKQAEINKKQREKQLEGCEDKLS